jgi:ABC-type polysaccharide/polyol phosphate transport system ATPase subunit
MSQVAIRADGLGKHYRITQPRLHDDTLRDALASGVRRAAHAVGALARRQRRAAAKSFWALRDVSFTVAPGEVVGIIGANGAGKSTLLRILSRITEPTVGEALVYGRVGSLLEVGTGFHPDLSGRDNVYLNGAILGMARREIARKFDEIVAFAEVEAFLDTPVKHYSTGMYLRLAFAVAAHLEPEILIVDEVLAVGDAAFQKRCLGKMDSVAREGRAVLFVSHNMDAVQRLCTRCLHIDKGTIVQDGLVSAVLAGYRSPSDDRPGPDRWIDLTAAERRGSAAAQFVGARFSSGPHGSGGDAHPFGPLEFDLQIDSDADRTVHSLAVVIRSHSGTKLVDTNTASQGVPVFLKKGSNAVTIRIAALNLNPGVYTVGLWLAGSIAAATLIDHVEAAFDIEVVSDGSLGFGASTRWDGVVATRFEVIQGER